MKDRSLRSSEGGEHSRPPSPLFERIIRRERELEEGTARAREEGRRLVEDARSESARCRDEASARLEEEALALISEARERGEGEAKELLRCAREEADGLRLRAESLEDSEIEAFAAMLFPEGEK